MRDFGPFPTKPMYEAVNRRMQRALAEATFSTGFAKTGQGAVTAGTGAQLVIAAYPDGALVDGLYVENPESEAVTLTTNANANPRIDRLVMRLDMAAQTIAPFQIVGTPAASPQVPPLTAVDLPLCRYTMPGSASAQNPGSIVDERQYAFARWVTSSATNSDPGYNAAVTTSWAGLPQMQDSVLVPAGRTLEVEWKAPRISTSGGLDYRLMLGGTQVDAGQLSTTGGVGVYSRGHLTGSVVGAGAAVTMSVEAKGDGSSRVTGGGIGPIQLRYRIS